MFDSTVNDSVSVGSDVDSDLRPCLYLNEIWADERKVWITNIVLIVVNLPSCLVAMLGNLLILLAVRRTRSLHKPSNALLCCLAASDFLVGAIVQPCFIVQNVLELQRNFGAYCTVRLVTDFMSWTCAGASFLTMCAIAVERVLALVFHLRYRTLVTIPRVKLVFATFWALCIALVVSRFFGVDRQVLTIIPIFVQLASLVIIIGCYVKIFLVIRRLQNKDNRAALGLQQASLVGYKKFTLTTLYVVAIFFLCYVPLVVAMFAFVRLGNTLEVKLAYNYITTLIFLNSCLNVFVYCLRIKSVRVAVFRLLRTCRSDGRRNPSTASLLPGTLARVLALKLSPRIEKANRTVSAKEG